MQWRRRRRGGAAWSGTTARPEGASFVENCKLWKLQRLLVKTAINGREEEMVSRMAAPLRRTLSFLLLSASASYTRAEHAESPLSVPDWYAAEREALEALYDATDGPHWKDLWVNKWKMHPCHCKWKGVTCSNGKGGDPGHRDPVTNCTIARVYEIDRNQKGLSGTLPAWNGTRGALASLTRLDLFANHEISGTLPHDWQALTSLRFLFANRNKVSGTIPEGWAAFKSLEEMWLNNAKLVGVLPNWIGQTSSALRKLHFSSNQLSGSLPTSWRALASLKQLSVENNQLSGTLPPDWASMTSLENLSLFSNQQLSGRLPPEWGASMTSLEILSLFNCQLTGSLPKLLPSSLKELLLYTNKFSGPLPSEWGKLSSLVRLVLGRNSGLEGSLPDEWASLSQLTTLDLNTLALSGSLPPSWSNMTSLGSLDLNTNRLVSSLPPEWGNISSIWQLKLSYNLGITGSLPPSWGSMTKLETLWLQRANITGSLPKEWARMSLLRTADLSENSLNKGSLPAEWASLTYLETLKLNQNKLVTASLPKAWGRLTGLKKLDLKNTGIAGTIPAEWNSMTKLTDSLDLADNDLSGVLPPELHTMTLLQYLYLQNNKISGRLPSSWSRMSSMFQLLAQKNRFSGSIPEQWAALNRSLRFLDLHGSLHLSGTLPEAWGALSNLQYLNLYDNKLRGSLPSSWSNMASMWNLAVNKNRLSGILPNSWGNLKDMSSMRLGENDFSGSFPPKWGEMRQLTYLNAKSNLLAGTLPDEWSTMSNLLSLKLISNRVSGTLPPRWANLKSLARLSLSANRLSGTLPSAWANGTILEGLQLLFLGSNQLRGSISSTWGNAGNFFVFDARHNHLTGQIPQGLLNSSSICILLLSDNRLTGAIKTLSDNFFRPFCTIGLDGFYQTPFRPALLLQDNRLSCELPRRSTDASDERLRSRDALARCLAFDRDPNTVQEFWDDQCHQLFNDSSEVVTNPAMILSGNLFDGPLPHDWGSLEDPMWDEAPFLYNEDGHGHDGVGNLMNLVVPGFTMISAYLITGVILVVVAYLSLPPKPIRRHEVQPQINRRLIRVYALCVRWLGALSLWLLAVNLPVNISAARYFTCGNPLLRTSSAYVADSPAQEFALGISNVVTVLLGIALVSHLYRIVGEERGEATPPGQNASSRSNDDGGGGDDDDDDDNGQIQDHSCPRLVRATWAAAWLGAALLLCIPTAVYAMTTTVPIKGSTLNIFLAVAHNGAPIYLTLVNSLAIPWLARASSRRSGLPSSWLQLVSRLLTTWVVPAIVVMALDDSCGQYWVRFWDMCQSPELIRQMDVKGPDGGISFEGTFLTNGTLLDAREEICLLPDDKGDVTNVRTNAPQCARAVLVALTPLLLEKMAIVALALPALTVIEWRMAPRGLWARIRRDSSRPRKINMALDNIMAQVMTWLDAAIVFGPQIPLLAPLVLMAVAGQWWMTRVGLEHLGKRESRWNKSQPAVWSVVLSLAAQQAVNVWLYEEMEFGGGSAGGVWTAVGVRALTWLGAAVAAWGCAKVFLGGWHAQLPDWMPRLGRPVVVGRGRGTGSVVELIAGDNESNRTPLLGREGEEEKDGGAARSSMAEDCSSEVSSSALSPPTPSSSLRAILI